MSRSLVRRYCQGLVWRYLSRTSGNRFVRRFRMINSFFLHYSIECAWLPSVACYLVTDKQYGTLAFANPSMIGRYSKGVSNRLRSLASEYLTDLCNLQAGDLILDIGANIGEFSRYCVDLGARVIAIDPEEAVQPPLRVNLESKDALILKNALWSHDTVLSLYHAPGSNDTTLIKPLNFDYQSDIPVTALDKLVQKSPACEFIGDKPIKLLKIEAEGAEPEILAGAKKTLANTMYVVVDCGPERGIKAESTLVSVLNSLLANGFELIGFEHKRTVIMLRNRRFDTEPKTVAEKEPIRRRD